MSYNKPSKTYTATRSRGEPIRRKSQKDLLREARCASSLKSIAFEALLGTLMIFREHARWLVPLGFAALLVWGLFSFIGNLLDQPNVYKSYMTQECVKVVHADGSAGSCDSLPTRYNRVWVE